MARYIDADKLKQNLTELYDLSKWEPNMKNEIQERQGADKWN